MVSDGSREGRAVEKGGKKGFSVGIWALGF